jgi:hypothetical protein
MIMSKTGRMAAELPMMAGQAGSAGAAPGGESAIGGSAVGQRLADHVEHLGDVERLLEVVLGPATDQFHRLPHAVAPRHQNHRRVGMSPLHVVEHLDAVHLGHDNVGHDRVERLGVQHLPGDAPMGGPAGLVAFPFEEGREEVLQARVILDDQDSRLGLGHVTRLNES